MGVDFSYLEVDDFGFLGVDWASDIDWALGSHILPSGVNVRSLEIRFRHPGII